MDRGFEARGGTAPCDGALQTRARDQVDDRHSLGDVLVECRRLLRPWLRRKRGWYSGGDAAVDCDDLLSEASSRAIKAFPAFRGRARGQIVHLVKKILHDLVCDEARGMRARSRSVGATFSLERDSAAAALAESVVDDHPSAEAQATRREITAELCCALKRLPRDESRIVRCWMRGRTWEQIELRFGSRSRRLWRRALSRLKSELDDEATSNDKQNGRRRRKPR